MNAEPRSTLRVFLAAPFVQFITTDGAVSPQWRHRISSLRTRMLKAGLTVFNAHHNESWGEAALPPETCVPSDFRALIASDVVCAYLGSPPSLGVAVELGWASVLGRPIVLAIDKGVDPSPMIKGLSTVSHVQPVILENGWDDEASRLMTEVTLSLARATAAKRGSAWRDPGLDQPLGYASEFRPATDEVTER